MADLKVLSTGKCFWRIDDGVAALILEMFPAAIERVNPRQQPRVNEPPQPAEPTWGIGADGGGYPFIAYTYGAQTDRYFGPPEGAAKGFKKRQWSAEKQAHVFEGPEPPAHVVEAYRQRFTGAAKSFFPIEYHKIARGSEEE